MTSYLKMTLLSVFVVVGLFSRVEASQPGVAAAVAASFVVRSDDNEDTVLGSAVRAFGPRYVLTNAHVVGSAKTVILANSVGERQQARVLGVDHWRDIAVLEVETLGTYLETAEKLPTPGQEVYALGTPFAIGLSVTRGVVSALGPQRHASAPRA